MIENARHQFFHEDDEPLHPRRVERGDLLQIEPRREHASDAREEDGLALGRLEALEDRGHHFRPERILARPVEHQVHEGVHGRAVYGSAA